MAFARVQGSRVLILHSHRTGSTVRQQKIHEFRSASEARAAVDSDRSWARLCESFQLALGKTRLDRESLRASVLRALEKFAIERTRESEPRNPFQEHSQPLIDALRSIDGTPSPEQNRLLRDARRILESVRDLVEEKLGCLVGAEEKQKPTSEEGDRVPDQRPEHTPDQTKEDSQMREFIPTSDRPEQDVDTLFIEGLEWFNQGEWEDAEETLQEGLALDPNHASTLLYIGHCHSVTRNHELAIQYYSRVIEVVQPEIDRAIRDEPDEHVTIGQIDSHLDSLGCAYPDEHIPSEDGDCRECRESFLAETPTLYGFRKFRPFFHAVGGKARSLMEVKRYNEAIMTLNLGRAYDRTAGEANMLGECHFRLGNLREAELLYRELLWPTAYYVRALILERLGRRNEALEMALKASFKNVHIARMLLGRERRETTRWSGATLPPRLEASEFMYDEGDLFNGASGFKALLRAICDDPRIAKVHRDLEEALERRERDRSYRPPRFLWHLKSNFDSTDRDAVKFIEKHARRLLDQIDDPSCESWYPTMGDMIRARIVEQKTVNWRVRLLEHDRDLYFRPGGADEELDPGDAVEIRVSKAWFYRRSLFIAGECLRRIEDDR